MAGKYNEPSTLEARIMDLERRMRTMETAPRLTSASIGEGGLTIQGGYIKIKDDLGDDVVRLGALQNGSYGAEQRVGVDWVPLLQLSSGVRSANTIAGVDVSAGAGATSAWNIAGPSVTFTTYTGNVTIITVANAGWYGYKSVVVSGYNLVTNTGGIVQGPNRNNSAEASNGNSIDVSQNLVWAEPLVLAPGTYTITAAYQVIAGVSEAVFANFSKRAVMVMPF